MAARRLSSSDDLPFDASASAEAAAAVLAGQPGEGGGRDDMAQVLDAMPTPVSFYGTDLVYRFANRAYGAWFGHEPDDMVGQGVAEVIGEAAFQKVEPRIREALAGQSVVSDVRLTRADGQRRWMRLHHVPRFDVTGAVSGVCSLLMDVEADKTQAETLAAAREEAAWINENKTRFLIEMADQLREGLNSILSFSEITANEVFGPLGHPTYVEYNRAIHETALRLNDLASRVATLGTLESGSIDLIEERISLRDAVGGGLAPRAQLGA